MLPRLCVLTGLAWSLLRWASFSSLLRKELALEEGLALHLLCDWASSLNSLSLGFCKCE